MTLRESIAEQLRVAHLERVGINPETTLHFGQLNGPEQRSWLERADDVISAVGAQTAAEALHRKANARRAQEHIAERAAQSGSEVKRKKNGALTKRERDRAFSKIPFAK